MRLRVVVAVLVWPAVLLIPGAATARPSPSPMVERINAVRAEHGLPPLRCSEVLERSSTAYAKRLMRSDQLVHMGISPSSRFNRVGEALAMHPGWQPQLGTTIRRWLGSSGHRALVLGRSFRYVGAGLARGRFGGGAATIWVLQFGAG
jgi:uncharacterized protein YkwD